MSDTQGNEQKLSDMPKQGAARQHHDPPAILSGTPELGWTTLSCGMVGCGQINSIWANIGCENSIQIWNQYPFLWKVLIWA